MKKLTKKTTILLLLAVIVLCAVVLCACKTPPLTRDDIVGQGYSVVVKYDFNGGINSNGVRSITIYVRPNSRIPEPNGKDTSFGSAPSQQGKSLRGFFVGTKHDDGTVEYSDTPWNFATDKVTQDITLYALWWDNYTVAVHCDDGETDRIREITIKRDAQTGEAEKVLAGYLSATQLGMTNRTVISYYTDENHNNEITFPANLDFRDEEGGRRIDIYVESRVGNWTVVRTAAEFVNNMTAAAGARNFYIKNDIDLDGKTVQFPASYSGTFDGNNKTISNFNVKQLIPTGTLITAHLGMFGKLTNNAEIKNINFSNVTVTADTTGGRNITVIYIGMLAGSISNTATLSNVTMSGTLNYSPRLNATVTANKIIGEANSNVDMSTCHFDGVTIQEN